MKYKVIMHDEEKDERIEMEVEAKSVFDAIDMAAGNVDDPEEAILIEAMPEG